MSYVKLPFTCQDHAVGLQSVNQAIDNNDAHYAAIDAMHSMGVNGDSPYGRPLQALGRHDDILIARSTSDFQISTLPTPTLLPKVLGPMFGSLSYQRLAVGQWRIFIATPQLFGAVALMKAAAVQDYKANCFTVSDPSLGPSVIVTTWNIAGGPAAADLPFSLTVWAQFP